MFQPTSAFSGFSVNDLAKARAFYAETLGLQVDGEISLTTDFAEKNVVTPTLRGWPQS